LSTNNKLLVEEALKAARELGLEPDLRGGLIIDEKYAFRALSKILEKQGVIYLGIKEAVRDYPDLVYRYGFKKLKVDEKSIDNGIFLYVPRNTALEEPIYTCFALFRKGVVQRVYNLVVIEDNSRAIGATGCMALVPEGAHISLEEVYIGNNASYTKIMIHNWLTENIISAVKHITLQSKSMYYDIYLNNSPLKSIKFNTIIEQSEGSSSRVDQIVVAKGYGEYSYDTKVNLIGTGASSELVSRSIATDNSKLVSNLTINAIGDNTKGHIECKGMMLGDKASLLTVPALNALNPSTMLTHEASIGKIRREEIEYLLSKGFTEEEAIGIIVRGFLETGFENLPDKIRSSINIVLDQISKAMM
jgi:Fe-S cluster assembly scaffold protein SufB